MKTWIKAAAITVLFGAPAFVLGPVIWPPAAHGPALSDAQMPFAIAIFAAEALGFGLGISFLVLGFPVVRGLADGSGARAWAMYLSIGWLLVSWWPHDNLHMHVGEDPLGLLLLTYGFHLTLLLSGLVLASTFLSVLRHRGAAPVRPEARKEDLLIAGRAR